MVNMEKLRSLNCLIAKINAVHTGGNETKSADSDVAKGLEAQLLLAKGARIMLMVNLWTQEGLVNGIIQDIIYSWESKIGTQYSRLQIPGCLAWAHKS